MRNLDSRHGPVIPNPSHVGGLLPTASHKNESIHPFRMATTAILHSPPPPESHCRVQRGVLWLSLAAAGSLTTQGTDGYFSDGYGIKAKGRAGVALAEPDDAFGGANNPATIAFVEDRVDFGLDWFTPEREAQRTGSDWRGRRDFSMTTNYWPWWVGGLLLAAVAIAFPLLAAAPLGVSGALARLLRWRSEGADKPQDVNAATVESSPPTPPTTERLADAGGSCEAMTSLSNPAQPGGPDRIANLAFLLAVLVGGGLAGWVGGQTWEQARISPEFHRLFGSGLPSLLVLFGGGVLVGFGTRLSGGCTSGHGLSGCGRLQPASLVATAVFFGVAIAVSFLLERLLS